MTNFRYAAYIRNESSKHCLRYDNHEYTLHIHQEDKDPQKIKTFRELFSALKYHSLNPRISIEIGAHIPDTTYCGINETRVSEKDFPKKVLDTPLTLITQKIAKQLNTDNFPRLLHKMEQHDKTPYYYNELWTEGVINSLFGMKDEHSLLLLGRNEKKYKPYEDGHCPLDIIEIGEEEVWLSTILSEEKAYCEKITETFSPENYRKSLLKHISQCNEMTEHEKIKTIHFFQYEPLPFVDQALKNTKTLIAESVAYTQNKTLREQLNDAITKILYKGKGL